MLHPLLQTQAYLSCTKNGRCRFINIARISMKFRWEGPRRADTTGHRLCTQWERADDAQQYRQELWPTTWVGEKEDVRHTNSDHWLLEVRIIPADSSEVCPSARHFQCCKPRARVMVRVAAGNKKM